MSQFKDKLKTLRAAIDAAESGLTESERIDLANWLDAEAIRRRDNAMEDIEQQRQQSGS